LFVPTDSNDSTLHSTKRTYKNLNPIWAKAALLGSMWGSIEIIVGSFLHNLRVPFTGTILSAIGVALLVGGHSLWQEKGLIWRAGVVCALMKSISPSAVIIGPMIGILTEAIALELFVRISRGTSIGVVIGSGIAVCLPFVQNMVNLLIVYGLNIAALYLEAYKIAAKSLGIQSLNPYEALGLFLVLNALFGCCAAFLGIAIGKNAAANILLSSPSAVQVAAFSLPPVNASQRFSISMLIADIVAIPLVLLAISNLSLVWSSSLVGVYIICMVAWYPTSWKRFSKPRIWIGLIVVTVLAGLLLGEITSKQSGWTWSGILIGFQMSLRAIFMVVAFNVVSIELRNPKIIGWVLRRGFGQLATAMEIAFDTLPTLIASLGEQRNVLRHPVTSLSRLLLVAKQRLTELDLQASPLKNIFIVTGDRTSGKTSLLAALTEEFRQRQRSVGGILSPVVQMDSIRTGYDVINIQTGERVPLCRNEPDGIGVKIGEWIFRNDGIQFGRTALDPPSLIACDLVIIDEVGPLELENKVWATSLDRLIGSFPCPIILAVREHLIERVQDRWSLVPEIVWKIEGGNSGKLLKEIMEVLIKSKDKTEI
jgi:nucleoside-triphosphatase THEP1